MEKARFETKAEEQDRLKSEFKGAIENDSDKDDLLTAKKEQREDVLEELYDQKEELEADDKFLLDYIALEGWKGSSKLHQD